MKNITTLLLFWFARLLEEFKNYDNQTIARIKHDWEAVASSLIDGQTGRLQGFLPMIQCPEFDDLAEAILAMPKATLLPEDEKSERDLDFFTGKKSFRNPFINNPMFTTPKDGEALLDYALRFNGGEKQVALALMNMTLNLSCQEVEKELEAVKNS